MTQVAPPQPVAPPESATKPTVLVVDDSPDSLVLISNLLKTAYRVKVANNGAACLKIAQSDAPPDLILLDVMMPGMDGYTVCSQLKIDAATSAIPVIFLTGKTEAQDEEKGLALGAADFIIKPVSPAILLARVATQLAIKASADFLRSKADFLEAEVARRTRDVEAAQDATILAMSMLAETRDMDTGNHIRRTQHYVKALAMRLRNHPQFAARLDARTITMLFKSAPLHDIGKVGIPDRILLKPAKLTAAEFEIMKTHTTIGFDAIVQAETAFGGPIEYLRIAKEIAHSHQEKYDGSGYPQGLVGEVIPMSARLMAVADVYDALISTRIYKEGLPHDRAVQVIFQGRGSHFDPDMVDAFIEIQDEFAAIAAQFADPENSLQQKMEYMANAIAEQA
jgi:putative two-component system response regulator